MGKDLLWGMAGLEPATCHIDIALTSKLHSHWHRECGEVIFIVKFNSDFFIRNLTYFASCELVTILNILEYSN